MQTRLLRCALFVLALAVVPKARGAAVDSEASALSGKSPQSASAARSDPIAILKEQILPRLPQVPGGAKLKALIDDYEEVLGTSQYQSADVGANNAGIRVFLRRAKKQDPELVTDAIRFYGEISAADKQRELFLKDSKDAPPPLDSRASLADVPGDSRSPHLHPGWVWDLAMKHARGDANRAVRLIGLCGHDDVAQGDLVMFEGVERSRAEAVRKAKMQALQDQQISLQQLIDRAENDPMSLQLRPSRQQKMIPELRNALILAEIATEAQASVDLDRNMPPYFCPPKTSAFFLPESLGEGVKVPAELKDRLVWNQARSDYVKGMRRGELLPAKSYHIYGGALVACEMIGRGYSPQLVKYLQGWIAWAYRTQRMTNDLSPVGASGEGIEPLAKPLPELTDEEWEKLWADARPNINTHRKNYSNSLRFELTQLKSSFETIRREPASAPWAKARAGVAGEALEREEVLKQAFLRYEADPSANPFGPPLSYDDFKAQRGKWLYGAKFNFPENQRAAYRDYLEAVKMAESLWPEAKGGAFSFGLHSYTPVIGSSPGSQFLLTPFANLQAFKREQLERWHADPMFRRQRMEASTKADASYLFRQTTLSGPRTIAGVKFQLPATDLGFPFPGFLRDSAFERALAKAPEGWTQERYERARDRVNSWLIDWEWTVAQHEAGAAFAAKNCRPAKKPAAAHPAESSQPSSENSTGTSAR